MNEIASIISNLGFPIIMCLLLFKFVSETLKSYQEQNKSMQDTLDRNTDAILQLRGRMEELHNVAGD